MIESKLGKVFEKMREYKLDKNTRSVKFRELLPTEPITKSLLNIQDIYISSLKKIASNSTGPIVDMCRTASEITGLGYVEIALCKDISDGLSLIVLGKTERGATRTAVLAPPYWEEIFKNNPDYQLGGIIYTASQLRDMYNGKLFEGGDINTNNYNMTRRAVSYESEFILKNVPENKRNSHQQNIVKIFPNGFDNRYLYIDEKEKRSYDLN